MKKMRKNLIDLLNIHGVSGSEKEVGKYLSDYLNDKVDDMYLDDYYNLIAEKKCGTGKGAVVMLSAHMDTVYGVKKKRKLIEKNGVISSSTGALGADDRAGIAIILSVLDNLENINFNGTLRLAFPREEEIGCVGSSKIHPDIYKDTDLAIVVDRRGSRDIVVGCGMAFCSNEVGNFMENVAGLAGMDDWKCVEGGISDAMSYSEGGINAINLSAGYYNEHTDKEYVVLSEMWDTVKLITQVFPVINDFAHTFSAVGMTNKWVKGYKSKNYSTTYFEDTFEEDFYAETFDGKDEVFVFDVGMNDCIIQKGQKELIISKDALRDIISQLHL